MTLLEGLAASEALIVMELISIPSTPTTPGTMWDNRPTWDNWAKTPAPFDNRPTWDNWNKKK
ncbi:multiple cyclophane-containing RiPP AmcA [Streptomyces sp. NPDC057654]|uniref:multiple cyclophane-containing RiPP AmcA n=1 Tax=Streptomyces sp. NPDC057654 TaxID=3346196 RepID=UPI0036CE9FCE